MSPPCRCCAEQANKLNQQVLVMRKEIKNLRQSLDNALRAHRKHMTSLQSAVSKIRPDEFAQPQQADRPIGDLLEEGKIQTVPIGYVSSCFSLKNGTPRQPTVCGPSRATVRIQQSVFNNPEHSLVGLSHYSHVWVIFLFHKNGHLSYKAKVKPPRLNGQKVGVYSTRSPHRPNALGLTLAKLDRIVGDTIHLSEVDMIDGTPVLDIKPYIPDYDSPHSRLDVDAAPEPYQHDGKQPEDTLTAPLQDEAASTWSPGEPSGAAMGCSDPTTLLQDNGAKDSVLKADNVVNNDTGARARTHPSAPSDLRATLEQVKAYAARGEGHPQPSSSEDAVRLAVSSEPGPTEPAEGGPRPRYGEDAYSTIAGWVRDSPVTSLEVRFTLHAEKELGEFLPPDAPDPAGGVGKPRFQFLRGPEEAAMAIRGVLSADPRSVYRRTRCQDRLFFFTLDTADITCWFGPDFAEVLRVRPVERGLA